MAAGSSPLTRGKRQDADRLPRPPGLIPAHAGKTHLSNFLTVCVRAHPRSRGENADAERCVVADARLIPAHAGKTQASQRASKPSTAHPRSRGENTLRAIFAIAVAGSSPLTRGKHVDVLPGTYRLGLIPAHAGKTLRRVVVLDVARAHPRSRGENSRIRYRMRSRGGSSPLTRGKPASADAGSTQ